MKHAALSAAALALLACWFAFELACACVRTFILGQGYAEQMADGEDGL